MDGDRRQARSFVGYTSGYADTAGSFPRQAAADGVGCAGRAGPVFRAVRGLLRHPQTPGFNLSIAIGESSHLSEYITTRAGAFTNLPPAARWFPRKWDVAVSTANLAGWRQPSL